MNSSTIANQQQISQLLRLADLLAAEADQAPAAGPIEPPMLCRESIMTIGLLVPKLEAACQALRGFERAGISARGRLTSASFAATAFPGTFRYLKACRKRPPPT
jgi:hypothetical protein